MSNNFELEYNLGVALINLNKLRRGRIKVEQSHKLKSFKGWRIIHLGCVVYRLNRADDSFNIFKEALKLNPKYSECYNNIGNIFRCE